MNDKCVTDILVTSISIIMSIDDLIVRCGEYEQKRKNNNGTSSSVTVSNQTQQDIEISTHVAMRSSFCSVLLESLMAIFVSV